MIAQDLPGKPRYPIFSAVAALFHVLEAEEENNVMPSVEEVAIAAIEDAPDNDDVGPTEHCYEGVGANIDGPEIFVDLEANLLPANTSKNRTAIKKTKRQRKMNANTDQLLPGEIVKAATIEITVCAAASANNEMSDLSDSSDESSEDSDSQPSNKNERRRKGSTSSAKAPTVCHSGDDSINYSISSESELAPEKKHITHSFIQNDILLETSKAATTSQEPEKSSSEVEYWDVELSEESTHSR